MPRWLVVVVILFGCGGVPATPTTTAPPPTPPRAPRPAPPLTDDAAPIDPIAGLAPSEQVSHVIPGRVRLEIGGRTIEAPGGTKPLEVSLIARHANLVRVAIRLAHARFSVWTDRSQLLAVLTGDFTLSTVAKPNDETRIVLRAGAVVRRLARKDQRTRIRYVGGVEVEGWIPDDMLADAGPRRPRALRRPRHTRLRPQLVPSGVVIRREARWGSEQLAVVAYAYMLDTLREVDDRWALVAYEDTDVSVQGFVSRRDPPGRVHKPRDPELAPQRITPTAKVASGTCLYTAPHRDAHAIGYIVGDRDVMLDDAGSGWWTLRIDSPWGPLAFAARGPTRTDLATCAPAGSVPPSTLNPSPPIPAP